VTTFGKNILEKFAATLLSVALCFSPAAAQDRQSTGEEGDAKRILEELKRLSDDAIERDAARDKENERKVQFQKQSTKELYALGLRDLATLVEGPPGVAEKTRVWVAQADLARLPGLETIVHVKGPVTCGRIGCNIVILGNVGGTEKIILETIGETIESPRRDRIIINQGTEYQIKWRFNGVRFVARKNRR